MADELTNRFEDSLTDYRHVRSEARSIKKILSFGGVFSEEEIETLLRHAVSMAEHCAERHNSRAYKAVMSVLFEAAKVEQAELPQVIEHDHNFGSIDAKRSRLAAVAERLRANGVAKSVPREPAE